ncbi:FHA domain-containing protein [Cellulosimicrobium cellulans]|nr:FHA domain-containing protein [Cellulosimicrobium cellulans]
MSDVTCPACGSAQSPGAAFCAVCGQPFPRTGRPVAAPASGPVGGVQAVAGRGGPGGPELPYAAVAHATPDTTTEPEVYAATQKAFAPVSTGASPSSLAGAPFAGTGRRFLAYVVDAAVPAVVALVVLVAGLAVVGAPLGSVQTVTQDEAAALLGKILVVYVVAAVLALAWWVGVWFWEGSTGKTLGNLATGIRTVDAGTRGPVGFGRAALRWIIVGVVPLGGILVVLLSPRFDSSGRSQGWHDKAGRSLVLDVRGVAPASSGYDGVASLVAGGPGAYGGPAAPAGYPAAPGGQAASYPVPDAGRPAAPSPATPAASFAPPSAASPARPGEASAAVPTASGPVPDPWAFPSTPAPAQGGLITGVPGVGGGASAPPPAPAPAPAPTPAPVPASAPAAAAAPAVPEAAEPEWDSTRMSARDVRAMDPAPDVSVVLELESGERRTVDRPTLVGRNPQAPDDGPWTLVAVDDPTRSVSKTHAELRVDPSGLWLTDRGSTNGTVVSVPGSPPRVAEPGTRVRVPVGATIHVGDRRLVVHPGVS